MAKVNQISYLDLDEWKRGQLIAKAGAHMLANKSEVMSLIDEAPKFESPIGEYLFNPSIWKDSHWLWFWHLTA